METPGFAQSPPGFPALAPAVLHSVISSCGFWKPLVLLPLLALAAQSLLLAELPLLIFLEKP